MRPLLRAVLLCVAGAGLAWYAATRTWAVAVTLRPGLPELRRTVTGAAHLPWLVALAVAGLAGGGALLSTGRYTRRGLGVLLVLTGAGLIAAAVTGRATLDAGPGPATAWAIACAAGGALVTTAGVAAARHGHQWPGMGSRYERRPAAPGPAEPGDDAGPGATAGPAHGALDTRAAWDALDHGTDPTDR